MAHTTSIDTVVDLVHERDGLLDERSRLTAQIDRRISEVETRLRALLGAAAAEPAKVATGQPTIIDRVFDQLRQNPSVDNGTLAIAVYGEDSPKTRHNIRAQVWQLKKSGRIRQAPGGGWQPAQPSNGVGHMT